MFTASKTSVGSVLFSSFAGVVVINRNCQGTLGEALTEIWLYLIFGTCLSHQILSWQVLPTHLPPWPNTMPPQPCVLTGSWARGGPWQRTVRKTQWHFCRENIPDVADPNPSRCLCLSYPHCSHLTFTKSVKWMLGTKCPSPRKVRGHQDDCVRSPRPCISLQGSPLQLCFTVKYWSQETD